MSNKILFLTRLYHPHIGGVEKHIKNISKLFNKKGHKVTVLAIKHKDNLPSEEVVDGVSIRRFFRPEIKFLGLIWTWIWIFKNRSLIRESDIVHCHDVFVWYFPFRFLYPNKKVYTTFHGWEGKYPVPKKNILIKKISAKLSTKNICIGEYVEKYYGIKADEISFGATNLPKYKLKKNPKRIIYLGRLDKDTGLPTVLAAFEKLDEYSIDFCGDGPLAEECRKLGRVHGFADPAKYLASAKFCFAGGYLSIMEAFAHKCVVVVSYKNELKKDAFLMSPFKDWILISNQPKKLADKIRKISSSQKLYKNLIDNSYEWVSKQSWEKLLNQYIRLWQIKS